MVKFLSKTEKPNFYFVEMNRKKKFTVENEADLFEFVIKNKQEMVICPKITDLDHWPLLVDCDIKKRDEADITNQQIFEHFVEPYVQTVKKHVDGDFTYTVLRRNCVRFVQPKRGDSYYKCSHNLQKCAVNKDIGS